VELRAGDYADAARAIDDALASPVAWKTDADHVSTQQTRDVAFALRAEKPQTREPIKAGELPITRAMANLARSTGAVNGIAQEFVLDTGAGYSTITRSTAVRLKVRMLPDKVAVGSSGSDAVPAHLGIADEVEIAGNRFHNVVFLVMEDEALRFG